MSGHLVVEEIHHVSFVDGVIAVGVATGQISESDRVELTHGDGRVLRGEIGVFHIHSRPEDAPGRVRVSVRGDLAAVLRPGDKIRVVAGSSEPPEASRRTSRD